MSTALLVTVTALFVGCFPVAARAQPHRGTAGRPGQAIVRGTGGVEQISSVDAGFHVGVAYAFAFAFAF